MIEAVLRSLHHTTPEVQEILVYASGCTDTTCEVVLRCAQRDPRVRLLEGQLGKAVAWNALVRSARHDSVVFMDADTIAGGRAVSALVAALAAPPYPTAAAAVERPGDMRLSAVQKLLLRMWFSGFHTSYLSGRLYGFSRQRLTQLYRDLALPTVAGYPIVPTELVVEDLWLTAVLHGRGLVVVPAATVHVDVAEWNDVLVARAREMAQLTQLRADYPAVAANLPAPKTWLHRIEGLGRKLVQQGPRRVGRTVAHRLSKWAVDYAYRDAIAAHRVRIERDIAAGRGGRVLAESGRVPSKLSHAPAS